MEKPKQPTPEEIADMEKSRTISDAELLKDGAEYKIDEETGEKHLQPTKEQVGVIHNDLEIESAQDKETAYEGRKVSMVEIEQDGKTYWISEPDKNTGRPGERFELWSGGVLSRAGNVPHGFEEFKPTGRQMEFAEIEYRDRGAFHYPVCHYYLPNSPDHKDAVADEKKRMRKKYKGAI